MSWKRSGRLIALLVQMKLNPLVHNVLWPAVAGSILWTFLLIAIDPEQHSRGSLWPRLVALIFVGVFLAIDWVDTENAKCINDKCWLADMPLAASLSTFAVATQCGASWARWPLAAAFVIATIGHGLGAWDLKTTGTTTRARVARAAINGLGLVVLLTGVGANEPYSSWSATAAIVVVILLYCALGKTIAKWASRTVARASLL